jgi:hypothetical protein
MRKAAEPWRLHSLRHVPDGRDDGATADVPRDPEAHRPVAGAARSNMKELGSKGADHEGKLAHGFHCPGSCCGRTLLPRRPEIVKIAS